MTSPSFNPIVTCYCPECGDSWEEPLYTPVSKYDLALSDLNNQQPISMFGRQCPSCCIPIESKFEGEGL